MPNDYMAIVKYFTVKHLPNAYQLGTAHNSHRLVIENESKIA